MFLLVWFLGTLFGMALSVAINTVLQPPPGVGVLIGVVCGFVFSFLPLILWQNRYFERCWEDRSCVCHKGWARFMCWLDCKHGHGAKRMRMLNLKICDRHDKLIWKQLEGGWEDPTPTPWSKHGVKKHAPTVAPDE